MSLSTLQVCLRDKRCRKARTVGAVALELTDTEILRTNSLHVPGLHMQEAHSMHILVTDEAAPPRNAMSMSASGQLKHRSSSDASAR